jgi:hypothetical protein
MQLASIASQQENDQLEKHIRDSGTLPRELKGQTQMENLVQTFFLRKDVF